jgi:uncharacterized protein YutE (UPF0331/DUF86 family)
MLERLKLLEENITELLEFRKKTVLQDIQNDKSKEWALRYGFIEAIQIVIDIACHLVSKYNLGNPSTYAECIELLEKYAYIDKNLTAKLLGMVGLRNILIHEYLIIDKNKLYDLLKNIDDIRDFSQKIQDVI